MRYADKTMSPEAALRDLSHENPQARVRAADALGKAGAGVADRACPVLRGLLSDDNPDVRYTAALSLGELNDKLSVEALVDVVEGDGHPMPRQAAVIALGLIGDPRATGALTEALRSAPPDVRFQATTSLAQVNPEAAVGPLRRALKDEDPEVRGSATAALGDLGDPRAANAVARLLDDPRPGICLEAAVALSRLGDRRGTPVLAAALTDRKHCYLAAEQLYLRPDAEARAALELTLGRWLTPSLLRVWAAGALHKLGHAGAKEHLLELLGSRRSMVRGLAIEVLGELGEPWAHDALRELAASPGGDRWKEELEEALAPALQEQQTK